MKDQKCDNCKALEREIKKLRREYAQLASHPAIAGGYIDLEQAKKRQG